MIAYWWKPNFSSFSSHVIILDFLFETQSHDKPQFHCIEKMQINLVSMHLLSHQKSLVIFFLIRKHVTWPMKCDIIRTRICVAWCSLCCGCVCYVECTQLAFARNWIMHLDLFEKNQKGITWKCEKPPPPYRNLSDPKLGFWRIENTKHAIYESV